MSKKMSTKKVGTVKAAVEYVDEMKTVLDDLAALVERSARRLGKEGI